MTQEDIILNIMEEPCKEIGNAISQPIKAIKYFILDPIIKYNIAKESEYKEVEKELEKKIQGIKKENLKEAKVRVLANINEGLKYSIDDSELKEAFLNLLKSSIDKSKENEFHVSFSEILKQLEPDEARIIEYLNSGDVFRVLIENKLPLPSDMIYPFSFIENGRIPKIDVFKMASNGTHNQYIKNFTWLSFINFIENPEKINIYLDNLQRLNIIEIESQKYIANEIFYKSILTEHPKVKTFINDPNYQIEKGYIQLTTVGKNLAKCCCNYDNLKEYKIINERFFDEKFLNQD